jgi:hypothetical protein
MKQRVYVDNIFKDQVRIENLRMYSDYASPVQTIGEPEIPYAGMRAIPKTNIENLHNDLPPPSQRFSN